MFSLGPLLRVSPGWIKVSAGIAVSSEAWGPFPSLLSVGRIQFFAAGRLRSLLSCWLSAWSCSQLPEATRYSLPRGPLHNTAVSEGISAASNLSDRPCR